MAVNPDKNIVEQSLIARLIGKIKRIALDISDDVSAEETRAMAAEASAKTVVTAGENCSVTKTTASDGHDVYTINADGKPQVQSDWNQADSSKVDYIKNKPDLSLKEDVANKATTVRQSGSADDTHFPSEAAVRSAIDSAVSAAYKAAGTKRAAELTSSLLVAANEGNVYNITEAGTTDVNFVDGAGKTINVGDNVGVCKVSSDPDVYKFDLLSGFVDLSNYLTKTGDGSNVTITPDGSSGTTFSSGDKLSALAQKFINLVSSLKAIAFKDKVSDSDIDGVIDASHLPDSIKDKIVFIEASFNNTTQVFTCNDASYNDITGYLQSGKVPVVRVSVYANASATTLVRIHDLYYHGYDSQVDSPNTGKYKFGSTDGYEDGSLAFVTSVKCNDSTGWSDYQDYAVPSLTKMNTDLAGKESKSNKKTDVAANKTSNTYYPTCKAVYDLNKVVIFDAPYSSGANTYPNGADVLAAITDGKHPIIRVYSGQGDGYDDYILEDYVDFTVTYIYFRNGANRLYATNSGSSWSWGYSQNIPELDSNGKVPIANLPTASSVTSGDTTHVPTADAVSNYSNRSFSPGDSSKGNTLLFTVRFGSVNNKGYVNFLISLTYGLISPCIISAEFGVSTNGSAARGCFCYINGPEIGRTTLFYKQISATAGDYRYEIWMCDRKSTSSEERRCLVTIIGRDAIDITPGNNSVTSDVSGLTEFIYRQGLQYDTRSAVGSTNSQGTTPEWALLGSFKRLSALANNSWVSATVLVVFESRVSQVGTASVLINFTASASNNKVTSTWIGNSIPLSERPSFFVKYDNNIWYLYAYQNSSNRFWANYKSVELLPNNILLYSNDGAGYLDTAPSGVSQIPYEYNVPIFNSNTGVGSPSQSVYVDENGQVQLCNPPASSITPNDTTHVPTSQAVYNYALPRGAYARMTTSGWVRLAVINYSSAYFAKCGGEIISSQEIDGQDYYIGTFHVFFTLDKNANTITGELLQSYNYNSGSNDGWVIRLKYDTSTHKVYVYGFCGATVYAMSVMALCPAASEVNLQVTHLGGSYDNPPSELTGSVLLDKCRPVKANGSKSVVGSPSNPVYVKSDGSVEACNFNAAAYHVFNNGAVEIPDNIFKEYNQFIINNSNIRIYAERLVENICYKFYNYKGNYCQLSFAKLTNDTYTRIWNSDTATLSASSWTAWPSLSRPTSGICIVVRIGNTIYVSGY